MRRIAWAPGGVHLSNYDVVSFLVAVGLMVMLQYIVYRTKFGVSMRAVSFDATVTLTAADAEPVAQTAPASLETAP